jgi:succinate dehydrogenase flavoprotein subunit
VIGAGLAGERAAIEGALQNYNVTVLSLVPPRRSHSAAAQGGMQASLGNSFMGRDDSPGLHFEDTVVGSDWGCEQPVARLFAEMAPQAVREMAHWGVPWNRIESGPKRMADGTLFFEPEEKSHLIDARNFGGSQKWRACYTADGTGHALQYTVDSIVLKLGIQVFDRMEAIALIHDGEQCYGAVARCLRTGDIMAFAAGATVIATGGCGRLYRDSTNAIINEGTGMSLALDTTVVPLGNMEAIQFHPTGIVPSSILITEGARGDGGYLLDNNLHRFMPDYEPAKKDLAFRDVVARCMWRQMQKGHGISSPYGPHLWLDLRHLGKQHIQTNLCEIAGICRSFNGLDPALDLIPVRPVQHYSMGGIRTDISGAAYGLKGLFAVGETACWDLHGFNRLGGNSLSETLVAGKVVGRSVSNFLHEHDRKYPKKRVQSIVKKEQARIKTIKNRLSGENVYDILKEAKIILMEKVGIFRHHRELTGAVEKLRELYHRTDRIALKCHGSKASPEIAAALRLPGMLRLAICIAYGALKRTESRGSHYREDFPYRDDRSWLKRTLAFWSDGQDLPVLQYEPVTITRIPPGEAPGR